MPSPATRCTSHGAYFCERCRTTPTAAITLAEFQALLARVEALENAKPPRCTDHDRHGLQCTLTAGHPYGPVYQSSETDDRHDCN